MDRSEAKAAEAGEGSVASPNGLSTLGRGPDRFQPKPPACYRASGSDSHRQATTSFRSKS